MPRLTLLLPAVLAIAIAPAGAQTMTANGSSGVVYVPVGATLDLELSGPPGAPYFWLFNLQPGPTQIGGVSIPVDLGQGLVDLGQGASFPASGTVSLQVSIPDVAALSGLTIYAVGVVLDLGPPASLVVGEGVAFTFTVPGADAGPDTATLVGQPLTLDGSANLDSAGQIPAGASLQWSVIEYPAGSAATLDGAQSGYPVLTPDLPGTYRVDLQVQSAQGYSADIVEIEVFDLSFSSPADGSFTSGPVAVNGTLTGPAPASFVIDGLATPLVAGAFDAGNLPLAALVNPITATITTSSGVVLEKTVTVIAGTGLPLSAPASPGAVLRLGGASLDALEPPLEAALAAIPLGSLITAIPPIPVVNTTLFSATFAFTGASYDVNNVDVDLFPSSGAIGIAVTLPMLNVTADVTGTLLFAPYAEVATITADSAVISGELVISAAPSGALMVSVQNNTAVLNNFAFNVSGVLAGLTQLGAIQQAMQGALELALAGFLDLLPPALNPLLAQIVPTIDLSASGIPLQVTLPLDALSYDTDGLTLGTAFLATPTAMGPQSPPLTEYLGTPGTTPTFTTLSPVNALPFEVAAGFNDDLLNHLLAATILTGALDLDFTTPVGGVTLDAGSLALLVPGAGFEAFPATTPITLALRHTTAPAMTLSATGPDSGTLHVGNALVDFLAQIAPGRSVPVISVGFSATAGLALSLDPVAGTLLVTPGTVSVTSALRGAIAGANAAPTLASLDTVLEALIPFILAPVNVVPLPGAALGGTIVTEISVSPANPDTVIAYFDLP
jgi:hypothetical protein